jgi:8-oxo-dGTP pyrophosphatase MutT (NUDIX family)
MTVPFSDLKHFEIFIRRNFPEKSKRTLSVEQYTPSSVLMPVYEKSDGLYILFFKRTQFVKHHKGEISFPGGAFEAGDADLKNTALRETEEEIGVHPHDVTIIAELDDLKTPSRYHITPFIGIIPHPYPFRVNTLEVEYIFEVPLRHLLNRSHHRLGYRLFETTIYEINYYYFEQHTIWGVTGNILNNFISKIIL